MALPRVVIIGGGFGGLTAARALRRAPVRVIVIDRRNHHLFQPLLYQVATAGLSPSDIASPIRSILSHQRNAEVVLGEVIGVDSSRREVLLHAARGRVPYDHLVIATGSTHSYFGHEDWAPFAPGLKSIEDATLIRRKILSAFEAAEIESDLKRRRSLLTFVIVGAGPTGVELAGAISELAHFALAADFRHIDPRQTRIVLVEAGPRILASFPESLALSAMKKLQQFGVEVRTGARVEQVDDLGVVITRDRVESRNVIWAAGVVASPAAKWLGVDTDRAGRVIVEPDLSVRGRPGIFVIGDTAVLTQEGRPLPGVAPVAMQQGKYVADRIVRTVKGKTLPGPFTYRDKGNLATVGRKFAIVDIHGFKISGWFAWVTWLLVHVYYLIGFRNRVLVMLEWAWAYITFQRGARLIVQDRPD